MAGIVHGGGLSAAAAAFGGAPADWLDLSTGINPNMPDLPDIPASIWNRLPDQTLVDAARAVAGDWYLGAGMQSNGLKKNITSRNLPLPVPGTQSFIQILPNLIPSDRPVAILSPTYGEYAHCFGKAGFRIDAIGALEALAPDCGTLVVVNPNNPDGRTFSRDRLLEVHAGLRDRGGYLHVDEAFGDGRPELSLAGDASELRGLTVSRSFGKFFGLAGIRLGFIFARAETLDVVAAALGPWAVSGPALYIAKELMRSDRKIVLNRILERKAALDAVLQTADLTIAGGSELFALVAHPRARQLFEHLARRHILVRKFDASPDWLRIGLCADRQGDERLGDALSSFGT